MELGAKEYLQFRFRQWSALFLVVLTGVIAAAVYVGWIAFRLTEVGMYLILCSAAVGVYTFLRGTSIASEQMRKRVRKQFAKEKCDGGSGHSKLIRRELRSLARRYRRIRGTGGRIFIEVIPKESQASPEYRALMLDDIWGRDYLFVTAELWELLDADERSALVAHETAHEDQLMNHLLHGLRSLVTAVMVFAGGLIVWAVSYGEIPYMLLRVVLPGLAYWLVLNVLFCRLCKIVEFITDLRAVQVTRNVQAYTCMLRKIDAAEAAETPQIAEARKLWITQIFEEHPPTDERVRALEGIHGLQDFSRF
jgi:Zn-dependent protease with chaperone function